MCLWSLEAAAAEPLILTVMVLEGEARADTDTHQDLPLPKELLIQLPLELVAEPMLAEMLLFSVRLAPLVEEEQVFRVLTTVPQADLAEGVAQAVDQALLAVLAAQVHQGRAMLVEKARIHHLILTGAVAAGLVRSVELRCPKTDPQVLEVAVPRQVFLAAA